MKILQEWTENGSAAMEFEKKSTRDFSSIRVRILCGIVGLLLAVFPLMVLRIQILNGFDWLGITISSPFILAALVCCWFALRGQFAASRARMTDSILGGVIVGGIGFAAGFFGPMIFTPESNQGPLLGIFITGPLGVILGVILGTISGIVRTRREKPSRSQTLS